MIIHDTVSILIEKDGKILLVKRANPPEKGYWAVPGGHVDEGETHFQAAQREAKEEAGGIELTSKEPVFVFTHDAAVGKRHTSYLFLGRVAGKARAGSDAAELGFFTAEEMKKMDITSYTRTIINRMLENKV